MCTTKLHYIFYQYVYKRLDIKYIQVVAYNRRGGKGMGIGSEIKDDRNPSLVSGYEHKHTITCTYGPKNKNA